MEDFVVVMQLYRIDKIVVPERTIIHCWYGHFIRTNIYAFFSRGTSHNIGYRRGINP